MEKGTGRKLTQALLRATRAADQSVGALQDATDPVFGAYRRVIGRVMGSVFLEVLAYIWKQHPALEQRSLELAAATRPHELPATRQPPSLGLATLGLVEGDLEETRRIVVAECGPDEAELLLSRIARVEAEVADGRRELEALAQTRPSP